MLEHKKLFLLFFFLLKNCALFTAATPLDQQIIQAVRYGHKQKLVSFFTLSPDLLARDRDEKTSLFYAYQAQKIPLKLLSEQEEQDRLKVLSLIRKKTTYQLLLESIFLKHNLHEKSLVLKTASYL
jgi:hypothetical protein